ncbi:nuclease-related domain-containing protein [Zongyangia hominis]|uniref:NERD domain-containing protein n=1 Tax=Zongyangia hominis TaxID=2763677 RepID=A0A926I7Q3_9FIRM|nr:nuclease-related domain-containing protein [Zongyangia hominis]MBC8571379.1 NERD domain-containing protein [Zongyangia hominis]
MDFRNFTTFQWILAACVAAMVLLVIGVLFLTFRRMYLLKKGKYNQKKAFSILRRYASVRNFKVLQNVTVEINGRSAHIDLMLVGFFGILFFEVEDFEGEYYGNLKDETWAYVSKDLRKTRIPNAVVKLERDIDVIRTIFAANDVYKVQMEPMVLLSPFKKRTEIYLSESIPYLRVNELRKHLDKVKYDKDNNVDVPRVVSLIEQYRKN